MRKDSRKRRHITFRRIFERERERERRVIAEKIRGKRETNIINEREKKIIP